MGKSNAKKKEEKIVFFSDFKKEAFKKKVSDFFQRRLDTIKDVLARLIVWLANHPVQAAAMAGIVAGITKRGISHHKVVLEDRRRNRDFYDPRTGDHAVSKRNVKPSERVEIIRRHRDNKESYAEILYSMGMLK